jgi:hypothetical protein
MNFKKQIVNSAHDQEHKTPKLRSVSERCENSFDLGDYIGIVI